MSLLTHSEALTVSDAFLCSLYGDDLFGKWMELKLEMRFVTERDYISWLLEVVNCYRNNENLMQTTNNAESGKVEVASQVRADDNCNESQPLSVDQQQKLLLEPSAQEPSDITLYQRERLDNAELNQPSTSHEYYHEPSDIILYQRELLDNTDVNEPSTSHEYYEQRDGPVQKDTMDLGEEMLEGILLKHYLNGSVIKQEVSEVEDSEQSEVSRKLNQQPGDTATVVDGLSPENPIECEDALIEGVSFKLEAPSGLMNENCDENVYGDKSMSKDTDEVVVKPELSSALPDGSVDQEFMIGADCLPTAVSVLGLQPRPYFVNMCDNNGRVKRANHYVKKKVMSSQNHLSSPECESPLKRYRSGDKMHKCNGCNYSSASITDLIRHKRTHSGEKPYRCDKCPFAAARAGHLVTHKRTHTGEKPYRCDQCPYGAARASDLVRHKHTHTGEKPYSCDQCTYATAQAYKLVTHKRTHTGEKPYHCDKCPYAAAHAGDLVTHKRSHTGEKPYRCDKCPYATAHSGHLVKHKRTHTGEKPYRCDKCPYAAASADNLVTHKRTHTGEKPYRCDICLYAAARAHHLVAHKRSHTGEKPYQCDKCPYAAARADNLAAHKHTHTGEKLSYRCDYAL